MKTLIAFLLMICPVLFITFAQDTSLTVTANGNVGIGTSNPGTRLEVFSDGPMITTCFTTSAVFSGLTFSNNFVDPDKVIVGAQGTDLRLITNGNDRIAIKEDGKVGIGTLNPSEQLSVNGNISVTGNVDGVNIAALKADFDQRLSGYKIFGSLNYGSVTATTTWTKLVTTASSHLFTKVHSDSKIEVYVNARFRGGTFSGATGVKFQIRVDDSVVPVFDNLGSIRDSGTEEFISMFAVFDNLGSGTHSVSIWAQTNSGSSNPVSVDPGGWGGRIIVKETW